MNGTTNPGEPEKTTTQEQAQARAPNNLLKYFKYDHLPAYLQEVSKPFGDLALHLDTVLPDGAEKTVALRKLLEAKDCGVRALLQ